MPSTTSVTAVLINSDTCSISKACRLKWTVSSLDCALQGTGSLFGAGDSKTGRPARLTLSSLDLAFKASFLRSRSHMRGKSPAEWASLVTAAPDRGARRTFSDRFTDFQINVVLLTHGRAAHLFGISDAQNAKLLLQASIEPPILT